MGFRSKVQAWFGAKPAHFDEPAVVRFSGYNGFRVTDQLMNHLQARYTTIDRQKALTVPAVLRGRNLICSVATLPLQAVDSQFNVLNHPFLQQIDPNIPNGLMLAMTIEDLLFDAVAWWRVTSYYSDGYPYTAVRYDPHSVTMTPPDSYGLGELPSGLPSEINAYAVNAAGEKVIWMGGDEVSIRDVIRFDSHNPAFLVAGARAVGRALALDDAADLYATNRRMRGFFTPGDPSTDPASDENIIEMLDAFAEAREKRLDGYVPAALKYNVVQDPTPAELQIIAQQQRADLAIANALGIDPEDLGINTTSRTYQNATDRRQDKVNDVLAPYMSAITDRLSMPDVTKRGTTVRFWLNDYLKADPATRANVQKTYKEMGVIDAQDIQRAEGLPPKTIEAATNTPQQVQPPVQVPPMLGGDMALEAHTDPRAIFTRESGLTFSCELDATFAVDQESRTITGLAVPWGVAARSNGKKYRFERGTIKWSAVNRVKLLRDHVNSSAIGKAISLTDTDQGLVAKFKVSLGRSGDEALALAADEVLDGLSIGVDFLDENTVPDPLIPGGWLVTKSALREISLTAIPAFDDSRLTSVAASYEGASMKCTKCGQIHADGVTECVTPAPTNGPAQGVTFTDEQFKEFMAGVRPAEPATPEVRPVVDPTRTPVPTVTKVDEPAPYQFSRQGVGTYHFSGETEHDFSTDLLKLLTLKAEGRDYSAQLNRLDGFTRRTFADVEIADLPGSLVSQRRPDMWVPQRDYATPLWDLTGRGAPPAGSQKFDVPKFTSASGLTAVATEKTEPAGGSFVDELQTITPGQIWGKVEITRQVWRQGGNPAFSGILWSQMLREFFEDREAAIATFLATLTAATDISITTQDSSPSDDENQATMASYEAAIADLQFARGGNRFTAFAVHQALYRVAARVKDDAGRPLYPIINPQNANGTTERRYQTIEVSGTTWVPSYALGTPANASTNSWLFDPDVVLAWAGTPEKLFWDFGATVQTANIPQLSFVTVGLYADYAVANTDITGVRQVVFDPNSEA